MNNQLTMYAIKECGTSAAVEEQLGFWCAADALSCGGCYPPRPPFASTYLSEHPLLVIYIKERSLF